MRKIESFWNQILTILALGFLIAFSFPAFVSEMTENEKFLIDSVQMICWLAFAADLAIGIFRADNKVKFLKSRPLEVASVVLPFLRPLRLLRVISFGGLALQRIAIGRQFAITAKVAITTFFVAYVAAVQITITERGVEGSNIKNFSDGFWWAITTVTTVGYGDRYPTTLEGKFLAVLLMFMGISLVGVITATVAAWFIKMSQEEEAKSS
ncbi:Potassium channel domain containing protein [Candidatus Nanopelagicaceae bacterium]